MCVYKFRKYVHTFIFGCPMKSQIIISKLFTPTLTWTSHSHLCRWRAETLGSMLEGFLWDSWHMPSIAIMLFSSKIGNFKSLNYQLENIASWKRGGSFNLRKILWLSVFSSMDGPSQSDAHLALMFSISSIDDAGVSAQAPVLKPGNAGECFPSSWVPPIYILTPECIIQQVWKAILYTLTSACITSFEKFGWGPIHLRTVRLACITAAGFRQVCIGSPMYMLTLEYIIRQIWKVVGVYPFIYILTFTCVTNRRVLTSLNWAPWFYFLTFEWITNSRVSARR